jgi:hypothetical protein
VNRVARAQLYGVGLALRFGVMASLGCAPVQSHVRYLGRNAPRAASREVGVYWAVAPPWPYRTVAEVRVTARDERGHLDVALTEALARVREAGGQALLVRNVQTHTRLVLQSLMGNCGRFDAPTLTPVPRGPCGPVQALEVELTLEGVAIRRARRGSAGDARWPLPPPLGALPIAPETPARDGAGRTPGDPWYDLDEVLQPAP